ncbi:hypothetical protein MKX01_035692 [Papaver californicum]|nr:hypothetical protein MKX01_035692 [Papaver californicum]
MDQILHKYVESRCLKLHLAEIGTGDSVVVFLHGFPEIWYSWRHQMIAVAKEGYRTIAPDFRGYGLSEIPQESEKPSFSDLIKDLLIIFDSLSISKAFIIAKDFGARPGYLFAILHPERVTGRSLAFAGQFPEGFYILRWQKPGRAEADFGHLEVKNVIRNIYILFSKSELPVAPEDKEIMDLVDECHPFPLTILKFPGMEQYISSEKVKEYVPVMELTSLPEGTHFAQEQFPEQVNEQIPP